MSDDKKFVSKYTKSQRVAAMVCIVLLVLLYVAALVLALLKYEWAGKLARIAIGFTILLPCLIWVYIWMIGKVFHKHPIADVDLMGQPTDHGPAIRVDATEGTDNTESAAATDGSSGEELS